MDIVERLDTVREGMEAGLDDWPVASQIYEYKTASDEIVMLRKRIIHLEKSRSNFAANAENLLIQLKELTAERDKATQYWQIAEGRCDALKQQRDELLAELEELSLYVAYNGDDWVQKKAKAAIASAKEKQNDSDQ